ncbi:uncharacterized protein Z520_01800 [Fonsecaea multimorphosa CBS 102226]|uniref:Aconitase/3-isopropylmalate dehydratase large subunit alpha/beta/alpha domain-containing protein n=1 Tax=Fonsecaea multimorphosa CBS 102226 TaxID=1442371 RepID=A0A0D2K6W6_9EURO|nr:uncharacterized protein Z520_01800 [Fonsecaea multimorphosa CBS 102226]KIY01663.1 hypothetical protein Z520_01800 [Fonsecaea multimorphosa CBS 102226]OAL29858.1 hypothetical protein AYO22_01764 [Fonsecaea multimorphosa]
MAGLTHPPACITVPGPASLQLDNLLHILEDTRKIKVLSTDRGNDRRVQPTDRGRRTLLDEIRYLADVLARTGHAADAAAFRDVHGLATLSTDFGGLGLRSDCEILSEQDVSELVFLVSAHLEAINSAERARSPLHPLSSRPRGRRGMTLAEKIFAAHDINQKGEVRPGDVIRVDIDWILASELSWKGMERWYDRLGQPGIYRNDRFWLAGDHLVDPRVIDTPKIRSFIESSECARREFKMTDSQRMNYTIMHTEFCRERAQPGMFVIGSDSHTCSAGSVSCLAIGLGVADVILPLITGETWFKIPETVEIRFINRPKPGISGKDVILYVLKELKRNTVASNRVVEYTGSGVQYLSCDARFAIANMTTEFGGVTGIFVPDAVTQTFVNRRAQSRHRSNSLYFRPDDDAVYAETYILDLAQVEPFVARYPRPDDVVAVTEVVGLELQGCFIGACTTTEEDLVLAALVLEQAMKLGAIPIRSGKRKVVPGSMPILHNMRKHGLVDIFEHAGWEVGVPGCSYCVGMSADQAGKGETWLTSQNRNFENRMGPGAFGNLASAVTVAASSFNMKIANPAPLLSLIDMSRVDAILGRESRQNSPVRLDFVEPGSRLSMQITLDDRQALSNFTIRESQESQNSYSDFQINIDTATTESITPNPQEPECASSVIIGKVARLGDFVDTDALAPNEAISKPNITRDQLGTYCLYHTHPDFRGQVREHGHNIVVAGEAFGCGSSREDAVAALQGAGVQCVIAKSFAFIYSRNQSNLGLLGFEMKDPRFWKVVEDGRGMKIHLDRSLLQLEVDDHGTYETFYFTLSPMQRRLMQCGGAAKAFGRWGKGLWEALTSQKPDHDIKNETTAWDFEAAEKDREQAKLQW